MNQVYQNMASCSSWYSLLAGLTRKILSLSFYLGYKSTPFHNTHSCVTKLLFPIKLSMFFWSAFIYKLCVVRHFVAECTCVTIKPEWGCGLTQFQLWSRSRFSLTQVWPMTSVSAYSCDDVAHNSQVASTTKSKLGHTYLILCCLGRNGLQMSIRSVGRF